MRFNRRKTRRAHLLPGTAKGLLPVRVAPCSDWLEEEELEDLASVDGWERCSSRGFSLFHTTICGDEVMPFLLQSSTSEKSKRNTSLNSSVTFKSIATEKSSGRYKKKMKCERKFLDASCEFRLFEEMLHEKPRRSFGHRTSLNKTV